MSSSNEEIVPAATHGQERDTRLQDPPTNSRISSDANIRTTPSPPQNERTFSYQAYSSPQSRPELYERPLPSPYAPSYTTDLRHQNTYSRRIPSNPFTGDHDDGEPPSPMSQTDYHHPYRPMQPQYSELDNPGVPQIRVDTTFGVQHGQSRDRYGLGLRAEFPSADYGR